VTIAGIRPTVIVWDLETVPDLAGFASANKLVGKPDADIRAELGNRFPKHNAPICKTMIGQSALRYRQRIAK
jgi:hypothetical protein